MTEKKEKKTKGLKGQRTNLPKIETPWKYAFFVDVTFNDYQDYFKAKSIMKIMAQDFKVLGEYKNAKL